MTIAFAGFPQQAKTSPAPLRHNYVSGLRQWTSLETRRKVSRNVALPTDTTQVNLKIDIETARIPR